MADDLTYNESGTHVLVKNSETGGVWWSPADYLPVARLRGWEPATVEEDPLEGLVDREPEQTGFDPSAHSAAEVSDHLALHAESAPGEVERVLSLERAGKNRKSVVVPDGFDPITGE
jgi:hypothetical protein